MTTRQFFGTVFALESALAAFVFAVVAVLVFLAVVRRRAGARRRPSRRLEHTRPEAFYVAVLVAVAAFLVAYTARQNHDEHHAAAHGDPVEVTVTAFQWCWRFDYPQARKPLRVSADCRAGRQPTLVVPTGRPIRFKMASPDVIHSLWVPDLRYKRDIFPHHVNTVTLTVDREGRWIGRCGEFCGDRHHTMDFWLKAVSPAAYDKWLAQHAGAPAGGTPA
ncbi:cytochrome c oxidase subunit II [Streptomyces sp. NPDC093984]|uniref:cytochrome c oxidase subunit II n=1 Tax=Streptomyces sp. NPDC093984 TaxID=3366052 RepID=UPI003806568B